MTDTDASREVKQEQCVSETVATKSLGQKQLGQFSFRYRINANDAGQTELEAAWASGAAFDFKVTVPANAVGVTSSTFLGEISEMSNDRPTDGKFERVVVIEKMS